MKNRIQILLAAALAFTAGSVFAADCGTKKGCEKSCPTNKTHFTPRSHGVNLALERSAGWTNLVNRKDTEDAFGANLQAVFFMMHSTSEDELARYFLFPKSTATTTEATTDATTNACNKPCGSDCASVTLPRFATSNADGDVFNTAEGQEANGVGSTADLDLGFLVHSALTGYTGTDILGNVAAATNDTKLTLCPEHKAIGVTFDYRQDLKCLLKGLFLEVHVPVTHVKNTLGMKTSGAEAEELSKFLQGTRNEIGVGEVNAFKNLTAAKMSPCFRSETGVADVDVKLGYQFAAKCGWNGALNLGVTIPTGNEPDAEYVFDAIVGNGGHVGFGFGVDLHGKLWKSEDCDHSLKMNVAMNYRYLFRDGECRTLGLCINNERVNFGQYAMLIDRTVQPSVQQLVPAANVTTLRVNVTPGSQFDGIVSFNYNWCGFAFDLGYNLFLRSREKVKLACSSKCNTTTPFVDGKWAIATRNADMSITAPVTGISPIDAIPSVANPMTDEDGANPAPQHIFANVDRANLDTTSAETPSLTSHKLFLGLGYWTKTWEVPMLVGVGGHFEWADCDLMTNWGFNARLGVAF